MSNSQNKKRLQPLLSKWTSNRVIRNDGVILTSQGLSSHLGQLNVEPDGILINRGVQNITCRVEDPG